MRKYRYVEEIFVIDNYLECPEEQWRSLVESLPENLTVGIEKQLRPSDRHIRILVYHALFFLVSVEFGIDAKKLVISTGPSGKPRFSEFFDVFFNLSHSKHMAVLALSSREVGVDIEREREIDPKAIAEEFFDDREIRRLSLFDKERCRQEFFRIWTLKESYLKAIGTGLTQSLSSFSVVDELGRYRSSIDYGGVSWSLHHQVLVGGHHLGVCRDSTAGAIASFWSLQPRLVVKGGYSRLDFIRRSVSMSSG